MQPDERPLREPDATCEGCGSRGTVGRAARLGAAGEVVEEHRYCARCWPEWSAFYRARWEEADRLGRDAWMRRPPGDAAPPPPPSGMSFAALTWHLPLELVRELTRAVRRDAAPPPAEALARVASNFAARAAELEGPMPFEVAAFIEEYGSRAG